MENISKKRRVVKLKTSYGAEYVIPCEDIVWVRTGHRWPKGIYELLTANKRHDVKTDVIK